MSDKKGQDSSVVRVAAETAAKTVFDIMAKERDKNKRQRIDRRLRDTKRLMRSYREIKIHAGDAITSLSETADEDYDFFRNMMEETDKVNVEAIIRSKAKSAIMLAHIDTMIRTYEAICYGSKKLEEQRRYRVLEAMCLVDDPVSAKEIAENEYIDTRTVYKDFDAACEKMSALLFGIQWIERE